MVIYHSWFNLKPDANDLAFAQDLERFLGHLRDQRLITGYRLMRRQLGLGPAYLGDFHVMIEVDGLDQLDRVFRAVSTRSDPIETLHHAVNAQVADATFALYRDFPDPWRRRGQEKF